MDAPDERIRVAVVGGGAAAMATALELTRPEHAGRFEVTVYQLGWRLGGKGASGRGRSGRIEEHGLHLWMGWYENAFRLLRECYAELGRDWRKAFEPASLVAITDRTADGWSIWARSFPPTEGLPGDPENGLGRWTPVHYLRRTVSLLQTLLGDLALVLPGEPKERARLDVASAIAALLRYGEIGTLAGLSQAVALLEMAVGSIGNYPQNAVMRLLDAIGASARSALKTRMETEGELRQVWQVIDVALATIRGHFRFGLLTDPQGYESIDEYDSREWLLLNGASRSSVESGYLRGLYDLGFGYEDGDPERPRVSAAQALRGLLRAFFTYRGAFFWKMNGGMGDVVFAPIYEVLRRRGVRFEFFHRLANVRLAAPERGDPPHVESLDFDVQARVRGDRSYEPLFDVKGLACWPAAPDYAQLEHGEQLERESWRFECHWDRRRHGTRSLRVGRDFDFVVLGVGVGAIPHVCGEIVARDPRWRDMVEHVKTVATQAVQIWLTEDTASLGWPGPPVTVSGFLEPFDTWADMRHLLPLEAWSEAPRGLAYFCSALADRAGDDPSVPGYADRQRAIVRQNAVRFLSEEVRHLWPKAVDAAGAFRWKLLATPDREETRTPPGPARFDAQYWTANVNPSDRYTLCLPGSARYRISPLDSGYDNLTVCGDWTDCGFNSGCIETAVMSGRLAAHALSRRPALDDIIGFDHP